MSKIKRAACIGVAVVSLSACGRWCCRWYSGTLETEQWRNPSDAANARGFSVPGTLSTGAGRCASYAEETASGFCTGACHGPGLK